MKDWKLSEQYAIVALNGLESLHPSMAKDAVLRGIAAAKVFETYMEEEDTIFFTKIEEAVERAKSIKKKEEKKLEDVISSITDYIKENKSDMDKIKPIITKTRELGYDNPTMIDNIKDAETVADLIV